MEEEKRWLKKKRSTIMWNRRDRGINLRPTGSEPVTYKMLAALTLHIIMLIKSAKFLRSPKCKLWPSTVTSKWQEKETDNVWKCN